MAQAPAAPLTFTPGWVRLKLAACPGAAGTPTRVEVDGATVALAFSAGRSGGATLGILTASQAAHAGAQSFPLPTGSTAARDIVLAPWPFASPPPRLERLTLR